MMAMYQPPYMQPYGGYMQPVQPVQAPVMPQMNQSSQQGQNLVRVQGEAAAKAWLVAPGASVAMMDIEAPYLYLKSVGTDGVPLPLRRFRLTEETYQQQVAVPTDNDMIHRNEFDELIARVAKLEGGKKDEPVAKRNAKQSADE